MSPRTASSSRIGFMQGRLSPLVGGRIQAFPWDHWTQEYPAAEALGIGLMEWTLDHDRLYDNPLMTEDGRARIAALGGNHGLAVPSLTGDLFMQAPFWKANGSERAALLDAFDAVATACASAGIGLVVVPLVDNGSLATRAEEDGLVEDLLARQAALAAMGVRVIFESDYEPERLARFIERLPAPVFGINYDTGNSAALGFAPATEIPAYGDRIVNVHIKDRVRGGTTVPLGTGSADLPNTVALIEATGYAGNYILQTARAEDGDHAGALARYRDMTLGWLEASRGS